MEQHQPPQWPARMLSWLIDEKHIDIFVGDIEELYRHRVEQKGSIWAKLYYIKDSFDLLRPFALRKTLFHFLNHRMMYQNYFKISVRNMFKHKSYTAINLIGLTVGICCFLLIFLNVNHELSYDRYHEHAENIYRVVVEDYNPGGEISRVFTAASPKHGQILREDYAQVVTSVRFNPWNFPVVKYGEKQFNEPFFNFVEPTIFDVFSFEFVEGSKENALTEPLTMIITESTAEKYFDDRPAIGETLKISDGEDLNFKITGVVKDFPAESHMSYNFMASWITYENLVPEEELNDYYGNYNFPTYLRVEPKANVAALQAEMPNMLDKYIEEIDGAEASSKVGIVLQNLTDIHLNSSAGGGGGSQRYYVYLFSVIGILILLIACINYMNLATAKYTHRSKEIGVRKVMGARKSHVAQQFYIESICYTLVAMTLGLGLTYLALPWLNQFMGNELTLHPTKNPNLFLAISGIILLVGWLAGSYPASFMSRLNPIMAIRGQKVRARRAWLGKGLVVFQFTITVALVIGVFVIDRQIEFIRNKDVGFDREWVLNFWASPSIVKRLDLFKEELYANPNVLSATASSRIPTGRLGDALDARVVREGQAEVVNFRLPFIRIDDDYLNVYDMQLLVGEPFPERPAADSNSVYLLNETAVKKLGWLDPADAIGQKMQYGRTSGYVTGVVKDFNFESLHSAIQPMILLHHDRFLRSMSVKITGIEIPETMRFLEGQFKKYNPDRDFNAQFVDDLYNAQYAGEERLSTLSKIFSILAIIIACLGLLGMVAFSLEQRAKEISIRKVLGASATNILMMFSKKYLMLIFIAFLIAVPIVYYFIGDWLNTFEYHISPGVGLFLFAGIFATVIALATIWTQTLKFALSNPSKWLSDE